MKKGSRMVISLLFGILLIISSFIMINHPNSVEEGVAENLDIPFSPKALPYLPWDHSGTSGIHLSPGPGNKRLPQLVSDGSGGAIITWMDTRNGGWDIYAQRVDSTGASLWTVPVCTGGGDQTEPQIALDLADNCVYIVWQDYRSGNWDIYAQRVLLSGALSWGLGNAACVHTSSLPGSQIKPQIINNQPTYVIITWQDFRSGSHYDIYAQKLSSGKGLVWGATGRSICTATDSFFPP